MKPTISIDFSEWRKAAADLFATSKRSLPDFLNGQALSVASRALKLTPQASRADIENQLGQVATSIKQVSKGKNAGKYRQAGRVLKEDSLAARIVAKRFRDTGIWIAKGNTLEERAAKLISMRVSKISYIRSGWIPAVRKLASIVRQKPERASTSIGGAKQFGRDKGTAKPATWRVGTIYSQIENFVPAIEKGVDQIAEHGLRLALREASADMIATLAKRLKKDLAKFGAR